MLAKINIVFDLIQLGFDVLYTDSDIVFLTDIISTMHKIQQNAHVYDLII